MLIIFVVILLFMPIHSATYELFANKEYKDGNWFYCQVVDSTIPNPPLTQSHQLQNLVKALIEDRSCVEGSPLPSEVHLVHYVPSSSTSSFSSPRPTIRVNILPKDSRHAYSGNLTIVMISDQPIKWDIRSTNILSHNPLHLIHNKQSKLKLDRSVRHLNTTITSVRHLSDDVTGSKVKVVGNSVDVLIGNDRACSPLESKRALVEGCVVLWKNNSFLSFSETVYVIEVLDPVPPNPYSAASVLLNLKGRRIGSKRGMKIIIRSNYHVDWHIKIKNVQGPLHVIMDTKPKTIRFTPGKSILVEKSLEEISGEDLIGWTSLKYSKPVLYARVHLANNIEILLEEAKTITTKYQQHNNNKNNNNNRNNINHQQYHNNDDNNAHHNNNNDPRQHDQLPQQQIFNSYREAEAEAEKGVEEVMERVRQEAIVDCSITYLKIFVPLRDLEYDISKIEISLNNDRAEGCVGVVEDGWMVWLINRDQCGTLYKNSTVSNKLHVSHKEIGSVRSAEVSISCRSISLDAYLFDPRNTRFLVSLKNRRKGQRGTPSTDHVVVPIKKSNDVYVFFNTVLQSSAPNDKVKVKAEECWTEIIEDQPKKAYLIQDGCIVSDKVKWYSASTGNNPQSILEKISKLGSHDRKVSMSELKLQDLKLLGLPVGNLKLVELLEEPEAFLFEGFVPGKAVLLKCAVTFCANSRSLTIPGLMQCLPKDSHFCPKFLPSSSASSSSSSISPSSSISSRMVKVENLDYPPSILEIGPFIMPEDADEYAQMDISYIDLKNNTYARILREYGKKGACDYILEHFPFNKHLQAFNRYTTCGSRSVGGGRDSGGGNDDGDSNIDNGGNNNNGGVNDEKSKPNKNHHLPFNTILPFGTQMNIDGQELAKGLKDERVDDGMVDVCRGGGVNVVVVVVIAFAAFLLGIILISALWYIHASTKHRKKNNSSSSSHRCMPRPKQSPQPALLNAVI